MESCFIFGHRRCHDRDTVVFPSHDRLSVCCSYKITRLSRHGIGTSNGTVPRLECLTAIADSGRESDSTNPNAYRHWGFFVSRAIARYIKIPHSNKIYTPRFKTRIEPVVQRVLKILVDLGPAPKNSMAASIRVLKRIAASQRAFQKRRPPKNHRLSAIAYCLSSITNH